MDTVPNETRIAPEAVLDLLRQQVSLFVKLEAYAQRQRRLITSGNTAALLAILADRQRLSTALAEIATQLAPIRKNWADERARLAAGEREEADQLIEEMDARLARVMQADEEDARLLKAQKSATAAAMRTGHSSGQALTAYQSPAVRGAHRLDQVDSA